MKKIGLISDTHSYLDPAVVFRHFDACDEIWHAGDFGEPAVAEALAAFKPLRGIRGNIDGREIHAQYPLQQSFTCEAVPVFMIHIGGYPGRYAPGTREAIRRQGARLFISGHSHILKIMYDEALQCLHMNPGAAGRQGWHKIRTIIRFAIDGPRIMNAEVIELGPRG